MSGNFGYELDLTAFSEQEKEEVREQVKLYKEIRHLVQFGDFYRLRNPFEGNEAPGPSSPRIARKRCCIISAS